MTLIPHCSSWGSILMSATFRPSDLEAYLDEALPAEEMAGIEKSLRKDPELLQHLTAVHTRRNSGVHTLGEIWRRHRVSCPTREQLGSYLLKALPDDLAGYIAFHIELVGCRLCRANLGDLEAQLAEDQKSVQTRRRKYFQSSAGYLRREKA
jgi:hypothetical protein